MLCLIRYFVFEDGGPSYVVFIDWVFASWTFLPGSLLLVVDVLQQAGITKDMASTFDGSRGNHQMACLHAYGALGLIRRLHLDNMIPVDLRARVFQVLFVFQLSLNLVLWVDWVHDKSKRCLGSLLRKPQRVSGLLPILPIPTTMPRHWTRMNIRFWLVSLESYP